MTAQTAYAETGLGGRSGTKNKLGGKPTGAETETPKASSGEGYGEGVMGIPTPSNSGVWGSIVSSSSGVRGRAPVQNEFGAF